MIRVCHLKTNKHVTFQGLEMTTKLCELCKCCTISSYMIELKIKLIFYFYLLHSFSFTQPKGNLEEIFRKSAGIHYRDNLRSSQ